MSLDSWQPTRPRPSWIHRLRRSPKAAVPLLAWLAALGGLCWLGPLQPARGGACSGLVVSDETTVPSPAASTIDCVLVGLHDRVAVGQPLVRLASGQTVTAPTAGTVARIHVHRGDQTGADQALLSIVDPTPRRILAYVPESARAGVESPLPVLVRRPTHETLGHTRVHSVSPSTVRVPERLWRDAQQEEWAFEVVLDAIGTERPGERVLVQFRH